MRTLIIIAGGLAILGLLMLIGSRFGGGTYSAATAAKLFIPVWLVVALVNMGVGVLRAGYSVTEELPIFLIIFLLPAAVAAFVWWKQA